MTPSSALFTDPEVPYRPVPLQGGDLNQVVMRTATKCTVPDFSVLSKFKAREDFAKQLLKVSRYFTKEKNKYSFVKI